MGCAPSKISADSVADLTAQLAALRSECGARLRAVESALGLEGQTADDPARSGGALHASTPEAAPALASVGALAEEARTQAAPPTTLGGAALEKHSIIGLVNEAIRPEMGKLGARVKSVEVSVKAFSDKLGNDVEVWQAAVNAELQAALGKVKEQLKLHGDDVEVLKKNQEALGGTMEKASASDKEALGKRVKGVEDSVKAFSAKLGGDVEVWQKQMNVELQAAVAKLRETIKSNHEEMSKLAETVSAFTLGRGAAGGADAAGGAGGAGSSAMASEVAVMGKKVKAVEESVKSFSTKLGADVEAWQQAINTELQTALSKVKEQVHKSADLVYKCQRDVEAVAAGRLPDPTDKTGEPSAAPVDADASSAVVKRIRILEAMLSAHEMALQAHTETLEAHASWLENLDNDSEKEGEAAAPAAEPIAAAQPAAVGAAAAAAVAAAAVAAAAAAVALPADAPVAAPAAA